MEARYELAVAREATRQAEAQQFSYEKPTKVRRSRAPSRDFGPKIQTDLSEVVKLEYRTRYTQVASAHLELRNFKKPELLARSAELGLYFWPPPNREALEQAILLQEGFPADPLPCSELLFVTETEYEAQNRATTAAKVINSIKRGVSCHTPGCLVPYNAKTFNWCPKCDRVAICSKCAEDPETHETFRLQHEQNCSLQSYAALKALANPLSKRKTKPVSVSTVSKGGSRLDGARTNELTVRMLTLFERLEREYDANPDAAPPKWEPGSNLDVVVLGPGLASVTSITRLGLRALINGGWLRNDELDFYLNRNKPDPALNVLIRPTSSFAMTEFQPNYSPQKRKVRASELLLIPVDPSNTRPISAMYTGLALLFEPEPRP